MLACLDFHICINCKQFARSDLLIVQYPGHVKNASGQPIEGVQMSSSVQTDAEGYYIANFTNWEVPIITPTSMIILFLQNLAHINRGLILIKIMLLHIPLLQTLLLLMNNGIRVFLASHFIVEVLIQ